MEPVAEWLSFDWESAMPIAMACMMAWALWPISAMAAAPDQEPAIDCKTAYSTPVVEICAERDYKAADRRLSDAYRDAAASIDIDLADVPSDVRAKWHAALIEAQRSWIAYRDAECALTRYGGSGRASAETGCMTQLTKSRIEALQRHAHPR